MRFTSFALAALVTLTSSIATGLAGAQGGTLVVLNKSDGTASLIDRASGRVRATLPVGEGPHEVATSPDGRRAFACNYGTQTAPGNSITVLDLVADEVEATWTFDGWTRPHGIAVSPGGTRVFVTSEATQTLRVLDAESGKEIAAMPTKARLSHMVTLAPAQGRAFVANIGSNTITAVDLERLTPIQNVATGAGPEGIAVTPDGREVWVGNRTGDTISVIDARTLAPITTIEASGFPIRVQISPDGRFALASLAKAGAVAVYSVKDKKELRRIPVGGEAKNAESRFFGSQFGSSPVPVGLVITPDGKEAFVACGQTDQILAIDLDTWSVSREIRAGKEPDGMAFAPSPAAGSRSESRATSRPTGR